jgi:hypothetical protein
MFYIYFHGFLYHQMKANKIDRLVTLYVRILNYKGKKNYFLYMP